MKRIIALAISMLLATSLFSAEESASFVIKAYKAKRSEELYSEVNVIDALHSSLDTIRPEDKDKTINLNNHVNDLLGDVSSNSIANYNTHIIFSYRVTSNIASSFSLSIEIGPLMKGNGEAYIPCLYELKNIGCSFLKNSTTTSDENGKIEIKDPSLKALLITNEAKSFAVNWSVANTDKTKKSSETWNSVATIALSLDKSNTNDEELKLYSYPNAPIGAYKANVKLEFKVNE